MSSLWSLPSALMVSLPRLFSFVPVEERMTSLPSLLLTISCGMVLWEWPSSTASRPVVLAMTSVERHGSEDSSIPRCATATT